MPPSLLISSMANNSTSRNEVSLIAIVPLREWRMPTLMVSAARQARLPASRAAPTAREKNLRFIIAFVLSWLLIFFWLEQIGGAHANEEAILLAGGGGRCGIPAAFPRSMIKAH